MYTLTTPVGGQPFIAPSLPLDRHRLGKFEVLCRLSTGGMSEIFLATQSGLAGFNKLVVLKTILPDISGEEDFVRMFLDEARTTAAFNHPNIAQVYELDVADGQLFMAMEFVQGCTLVEMARACRLAKEAIPVGFTLQAVRDTALALHYAHNFTDARGRRQVVIHRDVAEKNIMVTYEGVTKLLDFGIAKALGRVNRTTIGMVKGTSGYMSPEQIRGEPLDGRSDIFALGVVLHECLTGMRLFHGKKPEDGMLAALKETVAPPSKLNSEVSPEVDTIVLKALARNRDDRFATALEMARAIEKAALGVIWHPEQTAELLSKHFTERRQETRRLLEGSSYAESTGEVRIDSLIARVNASRSLPDLPKVQSQSAAPSIPPVAMPAATATPTPQLMPKATAPSGPLAPPVPSAPPVKAAPPPVASAPAPAPAKRADAIGRAGEKISTAPARPKVLRDAGNEPKPINLPGAMPMAGAGMYGRNDFEEDDSEAKTIPAAALPDDIKALRKQLQERRDAEIAKQSQAVPRQPTTEPGSLPAFEPAAQAKPPAKGTPEKPAPVHSPRTPSKSTPEKPALAHAPPDLFPSGEMQSVTGGGPGAALERTPSASNDFEEDGLTAIASPEWVPEPKRANTTGRNRKSSEGKNSATKTAPRRVMLIAIIVISLLIAAACVLIYAFDIVPNEMPRNVGSNGSKDPVVEPKKK